MQHQAFGVEEGVVAAAVVAGAGADFELSVDFVDEPESEAPPAPAPDDAGAEPVASDDPAADSPPLAAGFTEA